MIQTILLPPSSWSSKSVPLSLWRFGCPDPAGGGSKIPVAAYSSTQCTP